MITTRAPLTLSLALAHALTACGSSPPVAAPLPSASVAVPVAASNSAPPPQAEPASRVTIAQDRLLLSEKIQFGLADATILEASFSLLDELARTIAAHPELVRIAVQGHASADGSSEKNLALSQARSEAIVAALTSRGLDTSRLVAEGFGDKLPIADNNTEAGRIANRRVDFVVLERKPTP
jgi:outer membrane protein OmpA-like peptidoglycan-associated protein